MVDALTREHVALLRLLAIEGVGPHRLRAAVVAIGSAEAVLALPAGERAEALGVPDAEPGAEEAALGVLARCRRAGVRVLGWHEAAYPDRLLHLSDPPPLLYLLGDAARLSDVQVAVVGARRATAYGRRVARDLGRALAEAGVTVLSGMALGIDGAAHLGALEAGGASNAVLASGPERASPRQHARLHRWLVRRGAVASEHPPGTPSLAHHFPVRNRLMSALAQAVVVVEAARRSGALITAREANDLGRDVFAVPGPIDRPSSEGANLLLTDGASLALDPGVVLRAIGHSPEADDAPAAQGPEGDPVAGGIWRAIGPAGTTVDEIGRRTGLAPERVLAKLTRLELDGWVETRAGGGVRRRAVPLDVDPPRVLTGRTASER